MTVTYALAFDALVAVLLVVTIVYAVILNRKLPALRDAKTEMQQLLLGFAEATSKAERGLAAFRDAAEGVGQELQRQIESGRALTDDLSFLMQRGANLADRLSDCAPARRGTESGESGATAAPAKRPVSAKRSAPAAVPAAPTATPRHRAAGLATAALGAEGDATGDSDPAISPKQAALLKALKAIR